MLRVVTLNIWNLSGPWRERRDEIVRWLRELDADIVCLQEIVDDGARNSARWVAERAGYEAVAFGGVEARPGVIFGPAILSRWPIDHQATHPLPNEPGPTDIERVLVHARTRGIDVFTTHLTSLYQSGALRERQCLSIDELVAQHADPASPLPPILAGDFNAEPDSTEIRFLTGSTSLDGRSTYWQDAWRVAGGRGPGFTWDNRNPFAAAEYEPDRRIDYVFVGWRRDDGAGRVEACRVICDRPLKGHVFPTDHFGLLADIRA
ncbi:MAG TPA: endonuclease/exonuclease/phosphatase family protein [Acidimicrobiales bacterium]|nr:endonuclease/exonuclease/phosphatase family protein [Acidimicrobiales bacterium]